MGRGTAGLVAVAVVAVLSGSALAGGGKEYAGELKGTAKGKVSFKVVQLAAGPAAKGFKGKSVPMECEGSDIAPDFKVTDPMPIAGDRFEGTFPGAPLIEITGRLKKGGKASGTLRLSPGVPGANCDSGVLRWTAERAR